MGPPTRSCIQYFKVHYRRKNPDTTSGNHRPQKEGEAAIVANQRDFATDPLAALASIQHTRHSRYSSPSRRVPSVGGWREPRRVSGRVPLASVRKSRSVGKHTGGKLCKSA